MSLEVPEGVQAFNLWTLRIMARMWDEFPRPQWFHTKSGSAFATSDPSAQGLLIGLAGQSEYFANTLNWLIDEDFLAGLATAAGDFRNVRLTTKGFSVLNEIPHSISKVPESKATQPLGAIIREAVAKQAVDSVASLVQRILLSGS
jgi:hypothetical protein